MNVVNNYLPIFSTSAKSNTRLDRNNPNKKRVHEKLRKKNKLFLSADNYLLNKYRRKI